MVGILELRWSTFAYSMLSLRRLTMDKMFSVFAEQEVEHLVLGAWGCGAFQNEPASIAKAFREYILKADSSGSFDNIVFAIPGRKNKEGNFDIFQKEFDGIVEKVVESWHPVSLDKSM